MELKYKPWIGGFFGVLGAVNIVLSAMTGRNFGILIGAVFVVVGVLMVSRPVVTLAPDAIGMRNLLGVEVKRHEVTPDNVRVEGNKVYVNDAKQLSLWMFNTDEATVRDYLVPTALPD
jgi:hypothetical protein